MKRTTTALAATTLAAGLGVGLVLVASPGTQSASGQSSPSNAELQQEVDASNLRSQRAIKQATDVSNDVGRFFRPAGNLITAMGPRVSQLPGTGSNGLPTSTIQDDAITRSKIDDGLLAYWARVSSAGVLSGSQGPTSAANTGLGRYQVTFPASKNISQCAYQATIASPNNLPPGPTPSGQISAYAPSNNVIAVWTYDGMGTAAPRPFHLTVNC